MPVISIKMISEKTCAVCSTVHTRVPVNARCGKDELLYWECHGGVMRDGTLERCNSTLVYAPSYSKPAELLARVRGLPPPYRPVLMKSTRAVS